MTIYEVIHYYETDGGFGDAVPCNDTVVTFYTREKADDFIEKYSNPHVYDRPYADLECGYLEVKEREIDIEPDKNELWWLQ